MKRLLARVIHWLVILSIALLPGFPPGAAEPD